MSLSLRMTNSYSAVSQLPLDSLKVFENAELIKVELERHLDDMYRGIDLTGDDFDGPINKAIHVNMNFSDQFEQGEIQFNPINYTFPEDRLKLGSVPFKWHIPTVLETIVDTESILKLMTAVLLEKSIIVVSEDQAKTSSVILGLIEMIQPFQWQFI